MIRVKCSRLVGWWLRSYLDLNSFCFARTINVQSIAITLLKHVLAMVVYFNLSVKSVKSSIC
jgi:hypothetical protein